MQHIRELNLSKLLGLLPEFPGITLIDIGAAGGLDDIGAAGGLEPRWNQLPKNLKYIGFEPDVIAHKKLKCKEVECKEHNVYQFAVWSESSRVVINFQKT